MLKKPTLGKETNDAKAERDAILNAEDPIAVADAWKAAIAEAEETAWDPFRNLQSRKD